MLEQPSVAPGSIKSGVAGLLVPTRKNTTFQGEVLAFDEQWVLGFCWNTPVNCNHETEGTSVICVKSGINVWGHAWRILRRDVHSSAFEQKRDIDGHGVMRHFVSPIQ